MSTLSRTHPADALAPPAPGANAQPVGAGHRYRLLYRALDGAARSLAFPCDSRGQIALDALTERARNNYLFARALVGRCFARPVIEAEH